MKASLPILSRRWIMFTCEICGNIPVRDGGDLCSGCELDRDRAIEAATVSVFCDLCGDWMGDTHQPDRFNCCDHCTEAEGERRFFAMVERREARMLD
jgi:hypothetical protein